MALPKSELPQGTLDMLILRVVALGPIHGYAIAQRIRQISRYSLQVMQGSLYPALHRLENKGLLAAEWRESVTRREAEVYRLSPQKPGALREETAHWTALATKKTSFLWDAAGGNAGDCWG